VDIQRAITDGRRRHRARRAAGYAGAAAVTAFAVTGGAVAAGVIGDAPPQVATTGTPRTTASATAPAAPYKIPGTPGRELPAAAPPSSCTIERLPAPDGAPMAVVSGADPTGRYVVGRSYPSSGGYQAVRWHDGKPRKVLLPGDREELLQDVNTDGTAVGWSYAGVGPAPYLYRDGKVTALPGVRRGSAYAINNAGAIAGEDETAHAAVVWPSATAAPIRLPLPEDADQATARDIDDDGTTVGTVDNARPYVWFPDGTHRELPMPDLDGQRAAAARVFSIRNGWATGVADDGSGRGDGSGRDGGGKEKASAAPDGGRAAASRVASVRWNVRTGEVRTTAGMQMPDDVNAHGWQIGTDRKGRAILVTDAGTVVLPGLGGREPGGLTTLAASLSEDGRTIGGQADDATGTIQAVVWRCR
jgi:uncharacterized membrane protein